MSIARKSAGWQRTSNWEPQFGRYLVGGERAFAEGLAVNDGGVYSFTAKP
jgi:hypothetical protein